MRIKNKAEADLIDITNMTPIGDYCIQSWSPGIGIAHDAAYMTGLRCSHPYRLRRAGWVVISKAFCKVGLGIVELASEESSSEGFSTRFLFQK